MLLQVTGVTKEVVREGHGNTPARGQRVTVLCAGFGRSRDLTLPFWSTKDPGQQPFTFAIGLGRVINWWDEGVMGMVSNFSKYSFC